MKLRTLTALGAVMALAVAAPAATAAPKGKGTPNQGDASKVLTVDNQQVSCAAPIAAPKVEGGGLGRTISVSADQPIDKVTVKSGKDAALVSASFDGTSGTITLTKDVSNYVVWTCPGGSGGGGSIPT
jgi:hypothetical protein